MYIIHILDRWVEELSVGKPMIMTVNLQRTLSFRAEQNLDSMTTFPSVDKWMRSSSCKHSKNPDISVCCTNVRKCLYTTVEYSHRLVYPTSPFIDRQWGVFAIHWDKNCNADLLSIWCLNVLKFFLKFVKVVHLPPPFIDRQRGVWATHRDKNSELQRRPQYNF